MARMRPSSKVNMNERGARIVLSHMEPPKKNYFMNRLNREPLEPGFL